MTMFDSLSLSPLIVGSVLGGVVLWVLHSFISSRRIPMPDVKGSTGWPLIGESIEYCQDPKDFINKREKKYGPIFKTSLFFQDCLVGTTSDFAKFVTSNSHIFEHDWPDSSKRILGSRGWGFFQEPQHMALKKLVQKPVLPESIKYETGALSSLVIRTLAAWAEKGNVLSADEAKRISWNVGLYFIFGSRSFTNLTEEKWVLENFLLMSEALVSLPLDVPGTNFRKGLNTGKGSHELVCQTLDAKEEGDSNTQKDILGTLMAIQDDPALRAEFDLDDDRVFSTLVGFLFASYDTLTTTFVWILKFLNEYPDVHRIITAEQERIVKMKEQAGEDPTITWEDTRKMEYSMQFLQELHRYLSLGAVTFRRAKGDAEYNGYKIPKGAMVLVGVAAIHHSPDNFSDPWVFNPARFKDPVKPFTYLPFSSGTRLCSGYELAKLISLLYIHHLVTKYRWQPTGPDLGTVTNVVPTPKGGYPIAFRKK